MHSIIPPSKASIWGPVDGCRAYPFIAMQYPQEETEDDRRGTAAHELGAHMIYSHTRKGIPFPMPADTIGQQLEGVVIDRDIYDSAQIYATDVVETLRSYKMLGELHLEESVKCPSVHDESFGTPDAWHFIDFKPQGKRTIHVWDFKNGHVAVDPFENLQCINYLSGILDQYGINGITDQTTYIIITIVQPNAYDGKGPVRRWECMASNLRPYFNILYQSAAEVFEQLGTLTRSGRHCRFCSARFACTSAINAGLSLYESRDTASLADDPISIGTHYAIVCEAHDRLTTLKKGLDAQIGQMLRSGQQIPGVSLQNSLARSRGWLLSDADMLTTGDGVGINLRKESVMTPKEAEDAGMDKDLVKSLSERKVTGFTVKRDNPNDVRRIFYGARQPVNS